MPKKYQKAKSSKKKYNNKTVWTTAGREVPKIHRKYQNCQTFKEATKRPKGAKKGSLESQKKGVLIPKNHQKWSLPNS